MKKKKKKKKKENRKKNIYIHVLKLKIKFVETMNSSQKTVYYDSTIKVETCIKT